MTDKMEVFELDDDFDPMADVEADELRGDEDLEEELDSDYMAPIPDADKSVIPPKRDVPPEERIQNLIVGLPGQKFRLFQAIEACTEPIKLEALTESMDAAFPDQKTVYDAPQIVRLLVNAGAIDTEEIPIEDDGTSDDDGESIQARPTSYKLYTASEAGLAAVAAGTGVKLVYDAIAAEDDKYLPIFRKVLEMISQDGGCTAKELDLAISPDPVCAEPRRYAAFFMNILEQTDAIRWTDTWNITELGREVLDSDIFA